MTTKLDELKALIEEAESLGREGAWISIGELKELISAVEAAQQV